MARRSAAGRALRITMAFIFAYKSAHSSLPRLALHFLLVLSFRTTDVIGIQGENVDRLTGNQL